MQTVLALKIAFLYCPRLDFRHSPALGDGMDTQTLVNVSMTQQVSPVSDAIALAEPSKQRARNAWRYTRKVLKRAAPLLIVGYFYPPIAIVYLVTGVYEVL